MLHLKKFTNGSGNPNLTHPYIPFQKMRILFIPSICKQGKIKVCLLKLLECPCHGPTQVFSRNIIYSELSGHISQRKHAGSEQDNGF